MKRVLITLTKPSKRESFIPLTWIFVIFALADIIIFGKAALGEDVSAGFAFDHFKLTLADGERTEAAGPFYYSQRTDAEDIVAFPPFYSSIRDAGADFQADDFLYPLLTVVHYGDERRWQLFQLLNASSGLEPDGSNVKQFTIFPIYFQQRAADTNLNYTAVVPFYGRLKHRLFRDEVYMVMFPAFLETRKRDVVTDNYFFPFVDVRHGDGLEGWQVWPFAGHEHKAVTTHTNGFGDTNVVAGHDHAYYLWPFYWSQINGIGTDNLETFNALLPFYAASRSPQCDSTDVLWPFFASIDEREKKYHEWQGPWPFVIFTRGEGKHTSRVWPLFSESHNDSKESDSYLWPLYVYTRTHAEPLDRQRARVAFYLYDRLSEKNTATGKEYIRLDAWPFFTWRHERNGNERLQILAPLEPAVPDNPSVERNWSPLWSLWRAEHNAATGASSQSLLWNLYRREAAPDNLSVSCLFGLYQYRTQAEEKTLRLFYLPLIHSHAKAAP
jgi:hypothetical protein